jgi:hypothetical protein
MKKLAIIGALLLSGCAAHRQLACRFIAVDSHGKLLRSQTALMHSHWHKGYSSCAAMITALATGAVVETITGDQPGVQVKGSSAERLRLKRFFEPNPAPLEAQGIAAERPHFKTLMEIAE